MISLNEFELIVRQFPHSELIRLLLSINNRYYTLRQEDTTQLVTTPQQFHLKCTLIELEHRILIVNHLIHQQIRTHHY